MMSGILELKNIAYKKIRMNKNYRFFNSNYDFNNDSIPFFKHINIVGNLKNRIKYSDGGSFLITGLRGVGKTTLVRRAIGELQSKTTEYIPVYINLSKEFEYKDVLFEIIRRLYESMKDSHLLYNIDSNIANQIILAYCRTSMVISRSNVINSDLEFSIENHQLLKSILLKSKIVLQAAEEASFLAYSPNDIEHDLLRILRLLHEYKIKNIKVIIIFDELDKLTPSKSGSNYFENILSCLKNILGSVDAISIFIGGLDLYEKWNNDTAKINSLYDSIFCWHQYVPCIWDSTETIFDLLQDKELVYEIIDKEFRYICENDYSNIIKPSFKSFLTYINFKSKGIPRKIYAEFNKFVIWKDEIPYFEISDFDINEINAYLKIWKKISIIFEDRLYKTVIEMDLTYITCFNMIDFLFSHANTEFTIKEIEKNLLYNSTISPVNIKFIIHNLLSKFLELHLLQKTADDRYIVTDVTIKKEENITIKDKTLLQEIYEGPKSSEKNEDIKQDIDGSFRRKVARYESGKINSFWESFVAKELLADTSSMSIFYVINNKNIPYIALLYKDKEIKKLEKKNCLYQQTSYKLTSKYLLNTVDIVMGSSIKTSLREISDGYFLSHIIESKIKIEYILRIIEQLLMLVIELRGQRYFNANIKANNIVIDRNMNVKLLDIKNLIKETSSGIPINTIGYSAPEMYTDNYNHLCDIYSIGILLWEMVSCNCVTKMTFKRHIDFGILERPKRCTRKLWKIILKATQFEPNDRYENAESFLKDIYDCKEYKEFRNDDYSIGTVTNIYSEHSVKITLKTPNSETVLLDGANDETTFLSMEPIYSVKPYLIRLSTNEMISINKDVFGIGKEEQYADYCIKDNHAISRLHAKIIVRDERYFVMDTNSINHTYVNDKQIAENTEVEIFAGDSIRCANERFVFHVE